MRYDDNPNLEEIRVVHGSNGAAGIRHHILREIDRYQLYLTHMGDTSSKRKRALMLHYQQHIEALQKILENQQS